MNGKIAYGIISSDLLDGDILDLISSFGGIDIQYINAQIAHATTHAGYVIPTFDSTKCSLYQYWKDISNSLQALELDWSEFDEVYATFKGVVFVSVYEDVITLYETENKIVTVLQSPYTVDVPRNDKYNMYGNLDLAGAVVDISTTALITSYTVPDEWLSAE